MSLQDWAGLTLTLLSIGVILISSIRWYIDIKTKPIAEAVEEIRKETQTNGGSSMRDEIKAIKKDNEEAKVIREDQKQKLDHLYDLFVEYVSRPR